MSVLVVGTVAFDSIETPYGSAERILGGSASYFAFDLSRAQLALSLSKGVLAPHELVPYRRRCVCPCGERLRCGCVRASPQSQTRETSSAPSSVRATRIPRHLP